MKKTLLIICLVAFAQHNLFAQTEFELDPRQSMLMTGKGPGQDGTINPYDGEDCYAIVENTGKTSFSIRIQQKGKIIKTIDISGGETKKFVLLKDHELYLDPNEKKMAYARVDYAKKDD